MKITWRKIATEKGVRCPIARSSTARKIPPKPSKELLLEEAELIAANHPSKDARSFGPLSMKPLVIISMLVTGSLITLGIEAITDPAVKEITRAIAIITTSLLALHQYWKLIQELRLFR